MSAVGEAAEVSVRPRYVIDVGSIRVVVDSLADAAIARRVAQELAALRARAAS
ncbi:hypothetical protein [Aureimonas sp. SK2]|uniref:hypothetical protein n=1 Tax=Aureimonas sp. SK2 TaxID=3015992 RepID=UPI002443B820|nr:hypothetical protein [Aureimonas sp. SK2]